jgi:predicted transcriptional regulator
MEINPLPEQQKAIEQLAAQNDTTPDEQIRQIIDEALTQQADYDRWFREKVREGRAAAERGEFVAHEEVGRMLSEHGRSIAPRVPLCPSRRGNV